jgi:uncharacterized protein YjgD (DUF1641 family)
VPIIRRRETAWFKFESAQTGVKAMAQPIPLKSPVRDPAEELQSKLREAPAEHAQALLSVYEVLQGLHDAGVLDLLRGALGSRDEVIEVGVEAAGSEASVRALRNAVLLAKMLGEIDPAMLKTVTEAVPRALSMMIRQPEKPGLWTLLKDFLWNPDFRHGMAAVNTLLEVFGKSLASGKQSNGRSGVAR